MSSVPTYILARAKGEVRVDGKVIMNKGEKYIIPLGWVGDRFGRDFITVIEHDINKYWRPWDINIKLDGKKLLVTRSSGLGDMVFLSPILKYIKVCNPDAHITLACATGYEQMVDVIPYIDDYIGVPVSLTELEKYDYHLSFMHIIESPTGVETDENVYDLFFKTIGVERGPCLVQGNKGRQGEWPDSFFADYGQPVLKSIPRLSLPEGKYIGIQPFSGSRIRDLPRGLVLSLIKEFNRRGYHVIIVCDPKEHRLIELLNLTKEMAVSTSFKYSDKQDIYNACRVITNCDWLITSDSSFAHIGPGLGVRTISIYGPFSANSRTKYYKKSWSIDTRPECRCRLHTPHDCPYGVYPSPCMDISPDYIYNIIDMYPTIE